VKFGFGTGPDTSGTGLGSGVSPSIVPEPSSLCLLGVAASSLGAWTIGGAGGAPIPPLEEEDKSSVRAARACAGSGIIAGGEERCREPRNKGS
jgi:hypothetical protein